MTEANSSSVCCGNEAIQISVACLYTSFKDTEMHTGSRFPKCYIDISMKHDNKEGLTNLASWNAMTCARHVLKTAASFLRSRSALPLEGLNCTSTHALRFATEFSIALQFNSPTFVSLIHDDTIMFGKNWLKRGGCQNHPASKFLGLLHFVVSQRNFFQTFILAGLQ